MSKLGFVLRQLSVVVVLVAISAVAAHGQLYVETFDTAAVGGPVSDYGWVADVDTGGIGTFDDTIFGGGDGNVVFVFGNVGDLQAIYSGAGEGINIDPTTFTNGVTFAVDADPTFNATVASPLSYWAVQIGGSSWYSSVATVGVGDTADPWMTFEYDFNSSAANWNQLTLTGGVGSPTIGAPAGSDLAGNITGIGIVVDYLDAGTHHYDNVSIFEALQPGDVDLDGDVDSNDFDVIRANMSTSGAVRTDGDLNRDGLVDLLDFGIWKDNNPFPLSATASVPEPSALAIVMCGVMGGLGRHMRRKQSPSK